MRRLCSLGVGELKVKLHRPVAGEIKTVTLTKSCGKWDACFSVILSSPEPLPATGKVTGIDVGFTSFAVLSDGTTIKNPRYYEAAQAKLRRLQRKVCRRKKASNRRKKAVQQLSRVHQYVRYQRRDFHHQVARSLINHFDFIAHEDLNIKRMGRSRFAKPLYDVGWARFLLILSDKAAEAGREIVRVNPNGTSQRCVCGALVPKTLRDTWHSCLSCQLSVSRDHAAALEILRLGLSLREAT